MANKKPESYSSLLSLAKEVEKKPKPINKKVYTVSKVAVSTKAHRRSRSRSPRRDKKMKSSNIKDGPVDWDIPDKSHGDFYCKPCDSHMNSDQMWEAHISGKRHLKNVKKGEAADPKYEYLDEDPLMIAQINKEKRPITGLEHIIEIRRLEQRPIYQCFLCSANVPSAEQLLEHITGTKHRLAFLNKHDNERYKLIMQSNLKKGHIEPVVEECIQKHESEKGRGKMLVKMEREDYQSPPRKSFKSDYGSSQTMGKSDYGSSRTMGKSDYGNSSKTNNPNLTPLGKLQRDKSVDRFSDDYSSRGRFAERDTSYYNRSSNVEESFKRYDRQTDLPSANDYKKNMENRKFEDDRYDNSRYAREEERHRDIAPSSEYDRYGNQGSSVTEERIKRHLDEDEKYERYLSNMNEDRYGDLRQVLEKKKTLDPYHPEISVLKIVEKKKTLDPYHQEVSAHKTSTDAYLTNTTLDHYHSNRESSSYLPSKEVKENTFSNALGNSKTSTISSGNDTLAALIGTLPENYLKLIEAMNPTVFLQLAIFKINRIEINTDLDLKLLDKLCSLCTGLSVEIKTNQITNNLQEQFQESMVQSGLGVTSQFTSDFKKIIEMVGQAKANSKTVNSSGNPSQQTNSYEMQLSSPTYTLPSQGVSSPHQKSSPVYSSMPTSMNSGFSWQHVDSTQSTSSPAFTSSSHIPGLTLTNDCATATQSSPFDVLNRQTKDIGIRTKSDSYRY